MRVIKTLDFSTAVLLKDLDKTGLWNWKIQRGVVCSDEEEITNILFHYYQSLFTSTTPQHLKEALQQYRR